MALPADNTGVEFRSPNRISRGRREVFESRAFQLTVATLLCINFAFNAYEAQMNLQLRDAPFGEGRREVLYIYV